jgi:hypothetical protein
MMGFFHRFLRDLLEIEPSPQRRRLATFDRRQLLTLLTLRRPGIPGLWQAETPALVALAIQAYETGKISDDDIDFMEDF